MADGSAGDGSTGSSETNDPNDLDDDGDSPLDDERRQHGPGPMRPSSSLRESPSRASGGRVADGSAGDGSATHDMTTAPETTWDSSANAPRGIPSGESEGRSGHQGQSDASAGGGRAGADADIDADADADMATSPDEARMHGKGQLGTSSDTPSTVPKRQHGG